MMAEFPHVDGVEHRFVDLPGLRMHIAEAGRGDPVLLLHGFPQHWWEWRGVIPQLAGNYRLIAPDLRGAGWTDAPPTGYERHMLLADLIALLDTLELPQVRVIAHDWTAICGFNLCLGHPERVRAYVSLAVPPLYLRFNTRMLRNLYHAWYQLALVTPGLGARLLQGGRQRLPRYLLRRYSARPGAISDADMELFLAPLRDPAHARAGSALYRSFIMPEAVRLIRGAYRDVRLTTPTLVLTGVEDPVVRAELLVGYEDYADDLEIWEIPGASHFIVDDQPDAVLKNALEFFARH
jgi:pimeloyl-ACP methyl ester carboxylesterase